MTDKQYWNIFVYLWCVWERAGGLGEGGGECVSCVPEAIKEILF